MKPERIERCAWCAEVIMPGEPRSTAQLDGRPLHLECGVRMVAGGAAHMLRLCTCCGGTMPADPVGMSKREAARWAYQVWTWVAELRQVMDKEKGPREAGPGAASS